MSEVAIVAYQIAFSFSIFILISLGLAIIFGMMGVINMAQGEFLMLGAYTASLATQAGVNVWVAFPLAAIAVGLFGILVERVLIRWLYGRVIDTLLATWGLSLFMVGGVTLILGPTVESAPAPLGGFQAGEYSIAYYGLVMIAFAVALLALIYGLWRYTRFGLIVRGTMQNPKMARALGVNTSLVYMLTFGFGSAITGLTGAILAPLVGASPHMGTFYIAKAFITVITAGPLPLVGTISASGLFGTLDGVVAYISSSVIADMGVLLVAIILLRLLPLGITGNFRRGL